MDGKVQWGDSCGEEDLPKLAGFSLKGPVAPSGGEKLEAFIDRMRGVPENDISSYGPPQWQEVESL